MRVTEKKQPDAFFALENPTCDAENAISILMNILHSRFDQDHAEVTGDTNHWYLSDNEISDFMYIGHQAKRHIHQIKEGFNMAIEQRRAGR